MVSLANDIEKKKLVTQWIKNNKDDYNKLLEEFKENYKVR
jgi:hypothetical protein